MASTAEHTTTSQSHASESAQEPNMTERFTNAEWAAQIAETQKKAVVTKEKRDAPRIGSPEFAATIDHTLLKLDATASQIDALCSEARTERFKSVCVRLPWVSRCISNLKGSSVVVACVVGFHEGTQDTYSKLEEAQKAVEAGASELDIVINHSILTTASEVQAQASAATKPDTTEDITASNTAANSKPASSEPPPAVGPYSVPGTTSAGSHSRSSSESASPTAQEDPVPDYSAIYKELAALRSLCPSPTVLKLILETSQLTPAQILAASHLAAAANFDFIKTSTGFCGRGASLEDVRLMTAAAKYLSTKQKSNGGSPVRARTMQVKASGGVRSLETAIQMLEAGATRLGTSSGLWIMQEARMAIEARKDGAERPGGGMTRLYTDDSIGEAY